MSKKKSLKPLPQLRSDKAAERFVDEADLAEYDLSEFKPAHFEFEKKDSTVNLRVPSALLAAVKAKAAKRGIPYQRLIREGIKKSSRLPTSKWSRVARPSNFLGLSAGHAIARGALFLEASSSYAQT